MSLIFDENKKAITTINCVAGSTPTTLESANDKSCAEIGESDTTVKISSLGMISSSPTASTTSSSSTCESGVVLKSNNNSISSSLSTSPVSSKSSISIRTSVNTISSGAADGLNSLKAHLNNNTSYLNGNQQQQPEENNYSALCNSSKMDATTIIDNQTNKNCPDILLPNFSNVSNSISYDNDFSGYVTNSNAGHQHQLHLSDINGDGSGNQQMLNDGNSLSEDPRTLQLALNLSMLGINDNIVSNHQATMMPHHKLAQAQSAHSLSHMDNSISSLQQGKYNLNTLNALTIAINTASNATNSQNICTNTGLSQTFPNPTNNSSSLLLPPIEERSKKSQNMTECVPVPSSEHVAEIVGRQGCKIKALRAKTNTYIKTPVRGEEPVFVVTGRKEDVGKAKREILSAADHFSLIRATRKPSLEGSVSGVGSVGGVSCNNEGNINNIRNPPCPQSIPGQITIQVRVPYRVVGLVVGPKGATIKHIQQETHTYIVTPSREKEPIFEVTGLPENVQSARRQIEAHIAVRTGSLQNNNYNLTNGTSITDDSNSVVSGQNTINAISQMLNEDINQDFLTTICKNGISSAFEFIESNIKTNNNINTADSLGSIDFSSSNVIDLSSETMKLSNYNVNVGNIDGGIHHHQNNIMQNIVAAQNNFNTNNNYRLQGNFSNNNNNKGNDYMKTTFLSNGTENVGGIDYNNCDNTGASSRIPNFLTAATTNTSKPNEIVIGSGAVGSSISQQSGVVEMMLNNPSNALMTGSCSSASSTSSRSANKSGDSRLSISAKSNSSRPELLNIWHNLGDSCEIDEGIGESPSIWNLSKNMIALTGAHCSPTTSISPTDSLLGDHLTNGLNVLNLRNSKECGNVDGGYGGDSKHQQQQQLVMMQQLNGVAVGGGRRECLICNAKEVTAALVPCGHNMFCMDCANRICTTGNANCPVCNVTVYHAMRILA